MSVSHELVLAGVLQSVLGFGLIVLGRWGVASADRLVPPGVDESERVTQRRGHLLGGHGCQIVGVALLVFAVATGVAALAGVEPTLRPR